MSFLYRHMMSKLTSINFNYLKLIDHTTKELLKDIKELLKESSFSCNIQCTNYV